MKEYRQVQELKEVRVNFMAEPLKNCIIDNHCSICFEQYEKENYVAVKCGHTFHKDCIEKWLRIRQTCPLCRESVIN